MNDRFLKALQRQPVDRTPIWIMRQAGRYLPEYRATRAKAGSFLKLCKTPELACEVTLQPLERFPLDAAILFSDILTIPDAMGLGLHFVEGEGPKFRHPLREEKQIHNLGVPDPGSELSYVTDAISLLKAELTGKVPLIGFAGSPWTLACYMIEGEANKDFPRIKNLCEENPSILHALLDKLAQSVILYLNAQMEAGVDAVMIFDTWGGMLNQKEYEVFSLAYMNQIIDGLKSYNDKPTNSIIFTKDGGAWIEKIAQSGCTAVGLDWTTSLGEARAKVGSKVALQGNLNPEVLYQSPEIIRQEAYSVLKDFGQGSGHIFNLGHGIKPDVNPDHLAELIKAVQELSPEFH